MFERTRIMIAEEKGILQSKKDIAKNLLDEGIDVNIISKVTGLSKDDISKIK